ncbi:mitochondrial heme biosynthesis ferrochelatase [Andalucia godoyi]|uniref:Ferrochelatase n=1 Tax=Andalucia godoyi TaxID=505711 RepID=A0A8K0F1W8_ANDGO|nr:mitochondrial heme biosynthesis ferrochelatase [Andalucia godoyi]|eukprot:ANDGO_01270.mRNA.1 mitochondrial heme biosynthesis ferrochelatase
MFWMNFRRFSSAAERRTGIVMMNMGGPSTVSETESFLSRLFTDRDIVQLPFQSYTAPILVRRRTPDVSAKYASIGGGSPIRRWTASQGAALESILNATQTQTLFKSYAMFRYADPLTDTTIDELLRDGIRRVVLFSQYPQWSCTTAGSSVNAFFKAVRARNLQNEFRVSIIDRWATHPAFISALANRIESVVPLASADSYNIRHAESWKPGFDESLVALASSFADKRLQHRERNTVLLFSAHSLPMKIVQKGDPYPQLVGATVSAVMDELKRRNPAGPQFPYLLTWQSQVGPLPWLGPKTDHVIEKLGKRGVHSVIVVPVAFTSDHIETLSEIDHDFGETAQKAGVKVFIRTPSMNGAPDFADALAQVVRDHLEEQRNHSPQYPLRCPDCTNPLCRPIDNPAFPIDL